MSLERTYKFSASRLNRLITPLTSFFMHTTKPNITYVFEDPADGNSYGIQSWAAQIHLAEAEKCRVMSIDLRKANGSKEHEHLFIRLRYPPGFETYIIAQRCVDIGSKSSSTLIMPQSSSPLTPASDSVCFSHEAYQDSYSVVLRTFHEPQPSLANLCSIMYAVSRHAPNYVAFDRQCFWFAGTVYGVVAKEFSGSEIATRQWKQGTYLNVPLLIADDIEPIRSEYRSQWQQLLAQTAPQREIILQPVREEARLRGREEGRIEGWAEGIEQGRAAGRAEFEAEIAELKRQLQGHFY